MKGRNPCDGPTCTTGGLGPWLSKSIILVLAAIRNSLCFEAFTRTVLHTTTVINTKTNLFPGYTMSSSVPRVTPPNRRLYLSHDANLGTTVSGSDLATDQIAEPRFLSMDDFEDRALTCTQLFTTIDCLAVYGFYRFAGKMFDDNIVLEVRGNCCKCTGNRGACLRLTSTLKGLRGQGVAIRELGGMGACIYHATRYLLKRLHAFRYSSRGWKHAANANSAFGDADTVWMSCSHRTQPMTSHKTCIVAGVSSLV